MHSVMPLLILNIFWKNCRNIKKRKKSWTSSANNGNRKLTRNRPHWIKCIKDYDAEQVMLSDELKKKREDELYNKEKELRDLQRKRFGFEGDLFKKRQELAPPSSVAVLLSTPALTPPGVVLADPPFSRQVRSFQVTPDGKRFFALEREDPLLFTLVTNWTSRVSGKR